MPSVFDHIAIVAHKITDAPDFLVGELGGVSGYGGPSGDFSWWHWDYEGGGRIEVIEALGPPGGFVDRHLERRGPGIHHVNFEVDSLRETRDRAEALGYTIVRYDDSHDDWKEAFLHPKTSMGIVVQIVEVSHHDHDHADTDWHQGDPPPQPAEPPPAVTVVGLRMRANDAGGARRLWGQLLGGDVAEQEGELLFTWPGSPMRVAVTLQDGDNGAEAIEVRSDRALALPGGPVPKLGTRFVQL